MEEFYARYLKQIQLKKEKKQYKKEHDITMTNYVFNKLCVEIKVLEEIEDFIWSKM